MKTFQDKWAAFRSEILSWIATACFILRWTESVRHYLNSLLPLYPSRWTFCCRKKMILPYSLQNTQWLTIILSVVNPYLNLRAYITGPLLHLSNSIYRGIIVRNVSRKSDFGSFFKVWEAFWSEKTGVTCLDIWLYFFVSFVLMAFSVTPIICMFYLFCMCLGNIFSNYFFNCFYFLFKLTFLKPTGFYSSSISSSIEMVLLMQV